METKLPIVLFFFIYFVGEQYKNEVGRLVCFSTFSHCVHAPILLVVSWPVDEVIMDLCIWYLHLYLHDRLVIVTIYRSEDRKLFSYCASRAVMLKVTYIVNTYQIMCSFDWLLWCNMLYINLQNVVFRNQIFYQLFNTVTLLLIPSFDCFDWLR